MRSLSILFVVLFLSACGGEEGNPSQPPKPPAEEYPCGFDDAEEIQASIPIPSGVKFAHSASMQPFLPADETVQLAVLDQALIGGVPAEIADWPASVYAHTSGSACSATVVGERVLMTAAHCVKSGGTMSFTSGANKYTASFTQHPDYKKNSTADIALGVIDRPVTGVTFERLAQKLSVKVGDTLRLTGYGCIRAGGGGGNDGIFRIGEATVTSVPSGSNFDIVTKGGAAICFGDSGGAVFSEHADGSREIVGINSRGNIKNVSYLPAVASAAMQDFAVDWANDNSVDICGLSVGARACRDEKPIDPPKPKYDFEVRSKGACLRGKMNPGYESKKDSLVDRLKSVLSSFF